jgi:ketosteroid isomerase-like protein
MAGSSKPTPLLASADDAEAQFYEALQAADLDALMGIWADEDEVACVLPGGPRVVGLAAIRQVCEDLFSANGPLHVVPQQVRRLALGGCAVHHVTERLQIDTPRGAQAAYILATNVYVHTAQGWRMVAHHASPGLPEEPPQFAPTGSHLH